MPVLGRVQGGHAAAVRLDLSDLLRAHAPQSRHSVLVAAALELVEATELALIAGDDQLAAAFVAHALAFAQLVQLPRALHAQPRLQRPRPVVDARVHHTAVARGLVATDAFVGLQHAQPLHPVAGGSARGPLPGRRSLRRRRRRRIHPPGSSLPCARHGRLGQPEGSRRQPPLGAAGARVRGDRRPRRAGPAGAGARLGLWVRPDDGPDERARPERGRLQLRARPRGGRPAAARALPRAPGLPQLGPGAAPVGRRHLRRRAQLRCARARGPARAQPRRAAPGAQARTARCTSSSCPTAAPTSSGSRARRGSTTTAPIPTTASTTCSTRRL